LRRGGGGLFRTQGSAAHYRTSITISGNQKKKCQGVSLGGNTAELVKSGQGRGIPKIKDGSFGRTNGTKKKRGTHFARGWHRALFHQNRNYVPSAQEVFTLKSQRRLIETGKSGEEEKNGSQRR